MSKIESGDTNNLKYPAVSYINDQWAVIAQNQTIPDPPID